MWDLALRKAVRVFQSNPSKREAKGPDAVLDASGCFSWDKASSLLSSAEYVWIDTHVKPSARVVVASYFFCKSTCEKVEVQIMETDFTRLKTLPSKCKFHVKLECIQTLLPQSPSRVCSLAIANFSFFNYLCKKPTPKTWTWIYTKWIN